MKILEATDVQIFEKTGKILVNEPPPIEIINRIIPAFISLTQEPKKYREQWVFHVSDADRPDDGLIERGGEEGKDIKFFLHYRPHLKSLLIARRVNISAYKDFLSDCDKLYEICANTVMKILHDLDDEMNPGFSLVERVLLREIMQRFFARLLYYPAVREIVAVDHPDRSLVTLHVWDDRPGLILEGDKEPYKASADKQLFFAGMRMEIITQAIIKAIQHYVRAYDNKSRASIVFFAHAFADITEAELGRLVDERTGILTKSFK